MTEEAKKDIKVRMRACLERRVRELRTEGAPHRLDDSGLQRPWTEFEIIQQLEAIAPVKEIRELIRQVDAEIPIRGMEN